MLRNLLKHPTRTAILAKDYCSYIIVFLTLKPNILLSRSKGMKTLLKKNIANAKAALPLLSAPAIC
jgi:hypothetical protein